MQWFAGAMLALEGIWSRHLFSTCANTKLANSVTSTIMDPLWWNQFWVLWDIMNPIHAMRSWGQSCPCHMKQRLAGQFTDDCGKQSVLLPQVQARVTGFLNLCNRQNMNVFEDGD